MSTGESRCRGFGGQVPFVVALLAAIPDVSTLLLGMDWMDPDWLLDRFGAELLWVSLLIIFVECGLFFPFLPGDTLLFALGALHRRPTTSTSSGRALRRAVAIACCCCSSRRCSATSRLRDRPGHRPAALRSRGPDPEEEVLRPDRGVLRQARQQGPGDRPVRARSCAPTSPWSRASPGWSGAGSSSGASSARSSGSSASPCSATPSAPGIPVARREHRPTPSWPSWRSR